MVAIVTTGDARALPFPDNSIDLIITSPPYYRLRRYAAGANTATNSGTVPIGEEADWRDYLISLIDATREMARVIKPTGSIFVNLGDRYFGTQAQNGTGWHISRRRARGTAARRTSGRPQAGIPRKSLMLLPERYRIACVDELGLIARAVVVWEKPNGLPESVRDRVRRSHEDWIHLTKSIHYHQTVDEIREPFAATTGHRPRPPHPTPPGGNRGINTGFTPGVTYLGRHPLGRLPGSVWTIPTQPLRVPAGLPGHFAAFPTEWPRRLISAWCPEQVCTACGKGRRPAAPTDGASDPSAAGPGTDGPAGTARTAGTASRLDTSRARRARRLTRHTPTRTVDPASDPAGDPAVCTCADTTTPTRAGVVLDVFGGSGTAALVADVLGRVGISLDTSPSYVRTARWRTTDPTQRARATKTPKKNNPIP